MREPHVAAGHGALLNCHVPGYGRTAVDDDAVRSNAVLPVILEELHHNDVRADHSYGSNSVNMAFLLHTDVESRRAGK